MNDYNLDLKGMRLYLLNNHPVESITNYRDLVLFAELFGWELSFLTSTFVNQWINADETFFRTNDSILPSTKAYGLTKTKYNNTVYELDSNLYTREVYLSPKTARLKNIEFPNEIIKNINQWNSIMRLDKPDDNPTTWDEMKLFLSYYFEADCLLSRKRMIEKSDELGFDYKDNKFFKRNEIFFNNK